MVLAPRIVRGDDWQLIEETGISPGYCALLGAGDGQLAVELALYSDNVFVHVWDPQRSSVAAMITCHFTQGGCFQH